jgi:acyl-CoA synthetase (AMP-forming)/AMP-acid ligase II
MGPRQWFTQVEGSNPLRSCGLVMPWADLEIWDEQNRPLPLGQPGQIVARVDGQMTGFWNDPEGTRERMVDGWVLTGDIGMIDKNGYLYLLDRAADMIISGGFNIWPMELENAITTHGGDGGGGFRTGSRWADALRRRRAQVGPDDVARWCNSAPSSRLLQERAAWWFATSRCPSRQDQAPRLREPFWSGTRDASPEFATPGRTRGVPIGRHARLAVPGANISVPVPRRRHDRNTLARPAWG